MIKIKKDGHCRICSKEKYNLHFKGLGYKVVKKLKSKSQEETIENKVKKLEVSKGYYEVNGEKIKGLKNAIKAYSEIENDGEEIL